ncbi:MAG: DUF4142 domain-containing protein [Chryseolinea sp.]
MATVTSSLILTLLALTTANISPVNRGASSGPVISASSISFADDKDFVMKAAEAGLLEIKAAQLAAKTSSNEQIKSFVDAMIKDHGSANAELLALAKKKSMTPRSALSTTSEQKLKSLSSKSGAAFDKAYAEAMVKDHQAAVELFKEQAANGKDADLKQWAAEKLPTLEHHLSMAQELASSLK